MRTARRFLVAIVVSVGLWTPAGAEEPVPPPSRPALVAVPSFQGTLPDGTPIIAIVVIPAENVTDKNAAWKEFEAQWPTRYQLRQTPATQELPPD